MYALRLYILNIFFLILFISMGIGDWGLGQSPIPNPQYKKNFKINLILRIGKNIF